MKIGVRAHDYGKMEIELLAETLRNCGYDCAQLALPRAFSGIDSYEDITLQHLERIRKVFEQNQIEIPVFGCYMDLGNPDPEIRKYAVTTLKKCLIYSKEIGAKVVGTETAYPRLGSVEKKQWYPYMIDSIQRVIEEAQRLDVKLAIEPVYWHPLDSMDAVQEVYDIVGDTNHLRMIFDASNLLEYPDLTDQTSYWKQWLSRFGNYIEAMHIKDFYYDACGQYVPTPLGKGVLCYDAISEWIHAVHTDMYLLREEMNPAIAAEDIAFMKNL